MQQENTPPALPKAAVVLDANIWLSQLLDAKESIGDFLRPFVTTGRFVILLSSLQEQELRCVIERDFADVLQFTDYKTVADWLLARGYARRVRGRSLVTLCRDPKDNYLLAMAKDGKAAYLVARDKDLLHFSPRRRPSTYGHTRIITFRAWRLLQQQRTAETLAAE